MPVLEITPRIRVEGGDASALSDPAVRNRRVDVYHAKVTNGTTRAEVLGDPGTPEIKSAHPDGLALACIDRNAIRVSPILYELRLTYDAPATAGGTGGANPLLAPPKIRWSSWDVERELDQDVDGNPIVKKTGEPFDPLPREMQSIPLLLVQRNVAWVNPFMIADYRWKVSADLFYGLPPGTCLIRRLEAQNAQSSGYNYWIVDAEIAILRGIDVNTTDEKAWYTRIRAQGFLVRIKQVLPTFPDPTTIYPVVRATKRGEPTPTPVLHRLFGPDGAPASLTGEPGNLLGEEITDPNQAQWYEWKTKATRPYATLGLIPPGTL